MEEQLFKVVFDGSLSGEFEPEIAREQFAKLFGLDKKRVEMLFSGKPYVIKNNVPEHVAMEFMIRLAEIGCECYIQEILDEDDIEQTPAVDRRKSPERRLRYRRGPRPGAIVPDRRLAIRRRIDRKYYLEIKRRKREMPLAFQSYSEDSVQD